MLQAEPLLQRLLDLTSELQYVLEISAEEAALDDDSSDARITSLLDQRQALLDSIGALAPAQRQLTPKTQDLLSRVQAQAQALLEALEARRLSLSASSSELRTAHSAMRAYLPAHQSESHYFEEET